MSEAASPAALRRKRLGQYFSGLPLARLLAALSGAGGRTTVADPFLGAGDMLMACLEMNPSAQVSGVEIEHGAWQDACCTLGGRARPDALLLGSAFSPGILAALPTTSLDLVITNPPYVRYQSQAGASADGLPNALEVRTGLLEALSDKRLFCHLVPHERDLLRELVRGYSGLADLAVPAWLLCAALTRPGGVLAMVVPEAWLSRDYARIVQCALLRLCRLRHVVEDAHASWFADASVRTTLVVAERVAARPSCVGWGTDTFLRTDIEARAGGNGSLVGSAWPGSPEPERQFAAVLCNAAGAQDAAAGHGWRAAHNSLERMAQELVLAATGQVWAKIGLGGLPHTAPGKASDSQSVPEPLMGWLGTGKASRLASLSELGFSVGQGLRTGANDFFHVTLVEQDMQQSVVQTHDGRTVAVPTSCLMPVVRNQGELDGSPALPAGGTGSRLLWLEGWALPEDAELVAQQALYGASLPRVLPEGLSSWIREQALAGVAGMSAVRTNARPARAGLPRWWYTLPPLAPRHRPDILFPRVNGAIPRPTLNWHRQFLVDANFSAIWTDSQPNRIPALLAILSTAWTGAALEHMCSVMGGGALKVEAAHLQRLPLPLLDDDQWVQFGRLGQEMVVAGWKEATIAEADGLLVRSLAGDIGVEGRVLSLRAIRDERVKRRCFKVRNCKAGAHLQNTICQHLV